MITRKIGHGLLGFAVLALAAFITLTGCPTEDNGGDPPAAVAWPESLMGQPLPDSTDGIKTYSQTWQKEGSASSYISFDGITMNGESEYRLNNSKSLILTAVSGDVYTIGSGNPASVLSDTGIDNKG